MPPDLALVTVVGWQRSGGAGEEEKEEEQESSRWKKHANAPILTSIGLGVRLGFSSLGYSTVSGRANKVRKWVLAEGLPNNH